VGDQFGWVTTMGARYTAVDTKDGREFLIPNEDFVTQRVVNWSYSNNLIRLEVKFGASYSSDPRKVQAAACAAAASVSRVLKQPAPVCHDSDGSGRYRAVTARFASSIVNSCPSDSRRPNCSNSVACHWSRSRRVSSIGITTSLGHALSRAASWRSAST